ncbi:armadillo-type protein [Gloeopeniophorella convolvens]|nr:armadillo-type protein [Gloeopeniophorella convolvens]
MSLIDSLFTSLYPSPPTDSSLCSDTSSRDTPPSIPDLDLDIPPHPLLGPDAPSLLSSPSPLESPNPFDAIPPPPSPPQHLLLALPQVSADSAALSDASAETPALHLTIPSDLSEPESEAAVFDLAYGPDGSDLTFDDGSLSTLERIYIFSRSQAIFHKVYITHAMPSILPQVSAIEAVEYVLPLLNGLAMDDDDGVKEALAGELVPIIWWFASNCRLTDDDAADPTEDPTPLPVQAFTPILGTLLLSSSASVGAAARLAIVEILKRVRDAHTDHPGTQSPFGRHERRLFEQEILQQVVIGIGRLDVVDENNMQVDQENASAEPPSQVYSFGNDSTPTALLPSTPTNTTSQPASPPANFGSLSHASTSFTPNSVTHPTNDITHGITAEPASDPIIAKPDVARTHPPQVDLTPSSPDMLATITEAQEYRPYTLPQAANVPISPPVPSPVQTSPLLEPFEPSGLVGGDSAAETSGLNASLSSASLGAHISEGADVNEDEEPLDASEQAAMGRLSSMSLMAAVSASGILQDDTKMAFVQEVERVAQDPVYWVRKEASYALGALAKVVPIEVIHLSLLPLFETLTSDSAWHVRHSALFALPAILSRLPPLQRRKLALNTVVPLALDTSPPVRLRVLETLGEVIYSFKDDPGGPPDEILHIFTGQDVQTTHSNMSQSPALLGQGFDFSATHNPTRNSSYPSSPPLIKESSRPLICAFNLPAVALTLGATRWPELQPLYVSLAESPAMKVRRTLAASAGEIARIIGPAAAADDVLPVWRHSLLASEVDVRMKAIASLPLLVAALPEDMRTETVRTLLHSWEKRKLGWKERESLARTLVALVEHLKEDAVREVCQLAATALRDSVSAVREACVHSLPELLGALRGWPSVSERVDADVQALARSGSFRQRVTFVACYQAILGGQGFTSLVSASYWRCLVDLAADRVVDVRIGVARLVGLLNSQYLRDGRTRPNVLQEVTSQLLRDDSSNVRAFLSIVDAQAPVEADAYGSPSGSLNIFSRPPPATPAVPQDTYSEPAAAGTAS